MPIPLTKLPRHSWALSDAEFFFLTITSHYIKQPVLHESPPKRQNYIKVLRPAKHSGGG
jgi:hypothetical protein